MYFVNRDEIEKILNYMEKIGNEFQKHTFQNFSDFLLLERLTHISIEAIIDVGNKMIDGFIMRDPGSYSDIIDILTDEEVLSVKDQDGYKEFIEMRKTVVQQYISVDHTRLEKIWHEQYDLLEKFPISVRRYLDEELGPVSAFTRE